MDDDLLSDFEVGDDEDDVDERNNVAGNELETEDNDDDCDASDEMEVQIDLMVREWPLLLMTD